jgi:hypothetical protein
MFYCLGPGDNSDAFTFGITTLSITALNRFSLNMTITMSDLDIQHNDSIMKNDTQYWHSCRMSFMPRVIYAECFK